LVDVSVVPSQLAPGMIVAVPQIKVKQLLNAVISPDSHGCFQTVLEYTVIK
jgi:hypothetical protein